MFEGLMQRMNMKLRHEMTGSFLHIQNGLSPS